jgi:hypothetical protein
MSKSIGLNAARSLQRLNRLCCITRSNNPNPTQVWIKANKYTTCSTARLCNPEPLGISGRRWVHLGLCLNNQTAEKTIGSAEKYDFLAETKQLLNIVAKSLYSEKEVFIRELVSNSSDAIEKLKYTELSSGLHSAENIPYEIHITVDDVNKTLTIRDTGVGMSIFVFTKIKWTKKEKI